MKKTLHVTLLLTVLSLVAIVIPVQAKSALDPGDIAIIGLNMDNPDEFAFVALVTLDAGTEIRFTDSGWTAAGAFRGSEGALKYTVPAGGISAGQVITYYTGAADFVVDNDAIVGANGFSLSTSGDQILAFQGASDAPSFIYALNDSGTGWQTDATSSNTSALPTGLTDGTSAVALPKLDNYVYTGDTSDTVANLRSFIGNPVNWTGSDTVRQTMPTATFTGPNAVTFSGLGATSPFAALAMALVAFTGLVVLRKRK
jgi:hypothetical protein